MGQSTRLYIRNDGALSVSDKHGRQVMLMQFADTEAPKRRAGNITGGISPSNRCFLLDDSKVRK